MSEARELEVVLILVAADLANPRFLVLDEERLRLPAQVVPSSKQVHAVASDFALAIVDLDTGWTPLRQTSLVDSLERPKIAVPFVGAILPHQEVSGDYRWATFQEAGQKEWYGDHFDIFCQAVSRV